MSNIEEKLSECLDRLEKLVIPPCIDAGDEITYTACKENIISEMKKLISPKIVTKNEIENKNIDFLSVDPHELAKDLIARTFDQHRDVLRNKLKNAEVEAEKWKAIALQLDPNAEKNYENITVYTNKRDNIVEETIKPLPNNEKESIDQFTQCEKNYLTVATQTKSLIFLNEQILTDALEYHKEFLDTMLQINVDFRAAVQTELFKLLADTKKGEKRVKNVKQKNNTELESNLPSKCSAKNRKLPETSPRNPPYKMALGSPKKNNSNILYTVQPVYLQQRSERVGNSARNRNDGSPLPKIN